MLSRVAGSVYWMFRYLERAQNIARFINTDFNQVLEDQRNQSNLWVSLVAVTGDQDFYNEKYGEYTKERIVRFLTLDERYPNSILSAVANARENARSIREIISSEMWEEINSLYLLVKQYKSFDGPLADPYLFCKQVIDSCYQFIGLFYSTMNRGEAWHFGRLGMLLERADKTSRILDVKYFILLPDPTWVGSAYDNTQWAALLKSVSGLEMYRKINRRINPTEVAAFLIFGSMFPRSVVHCIDLCCDSIVELSKKNSGPGLNAAQRSLFRLKTDLETTTIDEVIQTGLHDYLDSLQTRMNKIDQDIFQTFFAPKISLQKTPELATVGQSQS